MMHQLVPLVKLASCLLKNNDVFHPLTSNAMKVLFYARVLRDAYPLTSRIQGFTLQKFDETNSHVC